VLGGGDSHCLAAGSASYARHLDASEQAVAASRAKYDEAFKYAPNWRHLKEAREAVAKESQKAVNWNAYKLFATMP